MSFKWWYLFQMNRIPEGPPTRISKFDSRELHAPLYVYCPCVMTRQGRFTLKWRNEVDTHEHVISLYRRHMVARDRNHSLPTNLNHQTRISYIPSLSIFIFNTWLHPLDHIMVIWFECLGRFAAFDTYFGCLAHIVYINQ